MGKRGNSIWSQVEKRGCIQSRSINLACNYSVGIFCIASYSLIYCLQLQAAVNNSRLFCMHDLNRSNGLASVETDEVGNYLGHPYSKEQSTGKEGTKPFWLSVVQCNPSWK